MSNSFVPQVGLKPNGSFWLFDQEKPILLRDMVPSSCYRVLAQGFLRPEQEALAPLSLFLIKREYRLEAPEFFASSSVRFWTTWVERLLSPLKLLTGEELNREPESLFHSLFSENDLARQIQEAPEFPGREALTPSFFLRRGKKILQLLQSEFHSHRGGVDRHKLLNRLVQWSDIFQGIGAIRLYLMPQDDHRDFPYLLRAVYASRFLDFNGKVVEQPLGDLITQERMRRFGNAEKFSFSENLFLYEKSLIDRRLLPLVLGMEAPSIRDWIRNGVLEQETMLTQEEARQFKQLSSVLSHYGFHSVYPGRWVESVAPTIQISLGEPTNRAGFQSQFPLRTRLLLDGEPLTQEETKRVANARFEPAWIRGQWVQFLDKQSANLFSSWDRFQKERDGMIDFSTAMRILTPGKSQRLEHGKVSSLSSFPPLPRDSRRLVLEPGPSLQSLIGQARNATPLSLDQLRGNLRPYQRAGVEWLRFGTTLRFGLCLADDMGLGKTIQIIALLLLQKQEAKSSLPPSLLVLPTSLLTNWKKEIEQFAPSLRAQYLHRSMNGGTLDEVEFSLNSDLIVTTYGTLLRRDEFLNQTWNLIILDEAQQIKNSTTQISRRVRELRGAARVALTGTPIENSLADLWSLFDFLNRGYLGKEKEFLKAASEARKANDYEEIHRKVAPFILRREKSDPMILPDLPEKMEMNDYTPLTEEQAGLYHQLVEQLKDQIYHTDRKARASVLFPFLTRFKQLCDHPSLLLKTEDFQPERSGKFLRLRELSEEFCAAGNKFVLFTQYREYLPEALDQFLSGIFSQKGLVIHGGVDPLQRQKRVDAFQNDPNLPYLILTLGTGGVGLNLTAATHLIHFDRWWNPAKERQATDRVHRIGQNQHVFIHKMISPGTIEERIDQLIESKQALSQEILSGSVENLLTEMSDEELIHSFEFHPSAFLTD